MGSRIHEMLVFFLNLFIYGPLAAWYCGTTATMEEESIICLFSYLFLHIGKGGNCI